MVYIVGFNSFLEIYILYKKNLSSQKRLNYRFLYKLFIYD